MYMYTLHVFCKVGNVTSEYYLAIVMVVVVPKKSVGNALCSKKTPRICDTYFYIKNLIFKFNFAPMTGLSEKF